MDSATNIGSQSVSIVRNGWAKAVRIQSKLVNGPILESGVGKGNKYGLHVVQTKFSSTKCVWVWGQSSVSVTSAYYLFQNNPLD